MTYIGFPHTMLQLAGSVGGTGNEAYTRAEADLSIYHVITSACNLVGIITYQSRLCSRRAIHTSQQGRWSAVASPPLRLQRHSSHQRSCPVGRSSKKESEQVGEERAGCVAAG